MLLWLKQNKKLVCPNPSNQTNTAAHCWIERLQKLKQRGAS